MIPSSKENINKDVLNKKEVEMLIKFMFGDKIASCWSEMSERKKYFFAAVPNKGNHYYNKDSLRKWLFANYKIEPDKIEILNDFIDLALQQRCWRER